MSTATQPSHGDPRDRTSAQIAARVSRHRKERARAAERSFRWRLLVNWKEQLRGTILSLGVVTLMLVVLNLVFHLRRGLTESSVAHAGPEVLAGLELAHRTEFFVTIAYSIAFIAVFVLVRVIETHRIEGPVVNIMRRLEEIENGNLRGLTRIRKDDRLGAVADAIDSMVLGMKDRAREEVRELEQLATRAKRVDSKYAAKDVSDEILKLAARTRAVYEGSRPVR